MREFLVKTPGQFSSARPFNQLVLAYRDGAPARLSDVERRWTKGERSHGGALRQGALRRSGAW